MEYEEALKEFERNNPKFNFLLKRDVRIFVLTIPWSTDPGIA